MPPATDAADDSPWGPRAWLGGAAALLLFLFVAGSAAGRPKAAIPFDLDAVAQRARALASRPYEAPPPLPDALRDLDYDDWRQIRFRTGQSVWRDRNLPFTLQFFHPGFLYDRSIAIHEVDADGVHPILYSSEQFDTARVAFPGTLPHDLGYGGFRLHYPIKTPDYQDEVIVFLGASYFRAVGRNERFGLSARGLSIDTALPSGEEFPWFREFWLVRPARGATDLAIYALLDSPSLTGAYRFAVTPGVQTRVDTELRIYRRKEVRQLGFAPLTSMFFHGENRSVGAEDYRPEVHDSDGLLMEAETGEWIWRPLQNPPSLFVSSFQLTRPRGFGLLQRDRDFDHYQDLEARPDQRPSVWVAPRGDWGAGRVELVEIPSENEVNDNVVAYWVPAAVPPLDQPIELAYSLIWYGADRARPPAGHVVATRRDRGSGRGGIRFLLDFEGPELGALPEEAPLRGVVSARRSDGSEESILEQQVLKNVVTGGWRLVFEVPAPGESLELRAFLELGEDALTETWAYLLKR